MGIYINNLEKVIKAVANPALPMFIVNDRLEIVYFSEPSQKLFKDYYHLDYKPFFEVLNSDSMAASFHDIVNSLHSPEKGFSWNGSVSHKSREHRTLNTNITFFPLFDEDEDIEGRDTRKKKIDFYIVIFEKTENTRCFNPERLIQSLLKAVELKDNDTGNHNKRVSYYSREIARILYTKHAYSQVDLDFIENITLFAAMHDVGKIGTPDSILLKPGKLTSLEWDIMKEHTINGAFILSGYPIPMAKEISLSHHEWWDGSGYPYRLAGEMIPLSARIVAIADVYDAIRMRRSYKDAFPHEKAVDIILSHRGTHFDPFLTDIFKSVSDRFDLIWNEHKDHEDSAVLQEIQNEARTISLQKQDFSFHSGH